LVEVSSTKKSNFYFSLINNAITCSPPEPVPTQKIESLIITSNQGLIVDDSTFESGTDLSDFYSVVSRYTNEENQTIEEFITKQNNNPYFFGTYRSSFIIKLNRHIMMPEQRIAIKIKFDDLSTFELTTNDFIIE